MAQKRKRPQTTPAKQPANHPTPEARKSNETRLDAVYRQVREILTSARDRAWQAVNSAMVDGYWEVGRIIIEEAGPVVAADHQARGESPEDERS